MTNSNSADTGPASCLKQGLALLARRDHFSTELIDKLIEKGFSRDDALAAAEKLKGMKYLDDARTLEAYAAEMKRHKKGFLFFCMKLVQKKARSLFTDRELRAVYTVAEEREIARLLAAKMRWGDETRRRLATRGFSAEAANG
ncbi:MAG TPA: RecX family transcriptional regulator [bacterium]|nr:RecX family transcriptional regulator [bacterium]